MSASDGLGRNGISSSELSIGDEMGGFDNGFAFVFCCFFAGVVLAFFFDGPASLEPLC
jgi:hypothetical protein